jgi:hypothetical protein
MSIPESRLVASEIFLKNFVYQTEDYKINGKKNIRIFILKVYLSISCCKSEEAMFFL